MRPKLKDYFYFNQSERRGVSSLLIILIVLLLFNFFYPFKSEEVNIDQASLQNLKHILDSIDTQIEQNTKVATLIKEVKNEEIILFDFDPNDLNIEEWMNFGLSNRQANTILNYTSKGGEFRIKKDLKKMYSISDEKYKKLEPFILLPDSIVKKKYLNKEKVNYKPRVFEKVFLNSADSSQLVTLRGIGPTYASRILKFRTQLGGFVNKRQLAQVYGLTDSLVESFGEQLQFDTIEIVKIDINSVEAKELRKHPYIDWSIANSIVNYRKSHGNYKVIDEIKKSVLIDDSLFNKLKPYIFIVK
jgi:DNA uptake protein ComE-like DNA-binding protein